MTCPAGCYIELFQFITGYFREAKKSAPDGYQERGNHLFQILDYSLAGDLGALDCLYDGFRAEEEVSREEEVRE